MGDLAVATEWEEDAEFEAWAASLRRVVSPVLTEGLNVERDLSSVKRRAAQSGSTQDNAIQAGLINGLQISVQQIGENSVIRVRGDLDVYTSGRLREELIALVNDGFVRHIIDLDGALFLDSGVAGIIIGDLKRTLASGGCVVLAAKRESVRKVFRIVGLTHVLPLFDDVDQAAVAIGRLLNSMEERRNNRTE